MARVILAAYMVRYPLGGALSASLQWLVGLRDLGHEVYLLERSGWPSSCYDPSTDSMTDDCRYGVAQVRALLARFGLEDRWCFVDAEGRCHGLNRSELDGVLGSADVFIDRGPHGEWFRETGGIPVRILFDGDPGFRQVKMEKGLFPGQSDWNHNYYFTVGRNVGTPISSAPTAGKAWRPIFHPISVRLFTPGPLAPGACFTTVMNWQSYESVEYGGQQFGQKNIEFEKFITLPGLVRFPLELAVHGGDVPTTRLRAAGWELRDAHRVTTSFDSYRSYVEGSMGEFGVCKHVYVATVSGWFSDRSAAYLASGRPVVMQDTGIAPHLPCGRGLLAVRTVEEAAAALAEIGGDYDRHSRAAREIAVEYLDTGKVLASVFHQIS